MNRMILTNISILAAALLGMGCSDKDNPVLTDRNLDETATYFASSDDKKSDNNRRHRSRDDWWCRGNYLRAKHRA